VLDLVCFFNKACTAGSLQNSLSKNRLRRCLVCRRFILRLQLSLSFFSDLQACFASPRFTASMDFLRFSQNSQSNQTASSRPFLLRSRLKTHQACADMPTALLLAAWTINECTQNASLSTSPALSASSNWASNSMFSEICLAYT